MKDKTEVIKASAAIHIQNTMSLLQRRTWNILLAHAYDYLPTEEEYHVDIAELAEALGYTSRNKQHLQDLFKGLVDCKVEWNILDKDNEWEWGYAAMLSQATIKGRVCSYAYPPKLRKQLHNPRIYARISLSLQSKFESKHALALWELCLDYLDEAKNYGETPNIALAKYRKLMGIPAEKYTSFKDLNKYVIKAPVAEINQLTDFSITIDYKRNGRKVEAVKFRMRRVLQLSLSNDNQHSLLPDDDLPEIVQELMEVGLSEADAGKVWEKQWGYLNATLPKNIGFTTYIREKIDLLKRQKSKGKVDAPTGYLLSAIRENWSNPLFAEKEKESIASKETHDRMIRGRQLKILEEEKKNLYSEQNNIIHTMCEPLVDEHPSVIEDLTKKVLEERPELTRFHYESHISAVENYHRHHFLSVYVDEKIVARFPEQFKAVNDDYDTRLADLTKKIETLGVA